MKMKNGKKVPNCVPVDEKQDKDIKDKKGTQPISILQKMLMVMRWQSLQRQEGCTLQERCGESDDNFSAYKPASGDANAKTKPSKYTNKMKKKFPDLYKETVEENADKSLAKKAEASGISVSILKQVYKRGVAAWRTGHQ